MTRHLDIAKFLHYGKPSKDFIDEVRNNNIPGMSFEGVVCKAKHPKKGVGVIMFKLKSSDWYNKLKARCGADDELFECLK